MTRPSIRSSLAGSVIDAPRASSYRNRFFPRRRQPPRRGIVSGPSHVCCRASWWIAAGSSIRGLRRADATNRAPELDSLGSSELLRSVRAAGGHRGVRVPGPGTVKTHAGTPPSLHQRTRFIRRGTGVCPWRKFPNERNREMGISVSLILIAVGAILTWAVTTTVSGIDINVVGVILMIVGAAGLDPLDAVLVELGWLPQHAHRHDHRPRRRASALSGVLMRRPTGPAPCRPRTVADERDGFRDVDRDRR